MPLPLLVTFVAGASGTWRIDRLATVIGDGLPAAERLAVLEGPEAPTPTEAGWVLRGVTSNTRYTNRSEVDALVAGQQELSRPQATRAALIPIRKTEAWWALAQDERRAIFEEQSRHIGVGWNICRPSPGACTTVGSLASPSTSSRGSNMHRNIANPSKSWCVDCGIRRSGAMLTVRSISA